MPVLIPEKLVNVLLKTKHCWNISTLLRFYPFDGTLNTVVDKKDPSPLSCIKSEVVVNLASGRNRLEHTKSHCGQGTVIEELYSKRQLCVNIKQQVTLLNNQFDVPSYAQHL